MTSKKPQSPSSNPTLAELRGIRQEIGRLRNDLREAKLVEDESVNKAEDQLPWGAVALKITLGLAALISFGALNGAAGDMNRIESRAGNTVAEAYYQSMGTVARGLGFFTGATLLYFAYSVPPVGFKLTRKKDD